VIKSEARRKFGELLATICGTKSFGVDEALERGGSGFRARHCAVRHCRAGRKIPEIEQILSAGRAQNMLHAASRWVQRCVEEASAYMGR